MPCCIPMYLVDRDVECLCRLLDQDPDAAVILPDGPGRWKAHRGVPKLKDGQVGLWHVPSGPITLEPTDLKAKARTVKSPFAGWREIVSPVEPGVPWLGPASTGVVWLTVRRRAGPSSHTFRTMNRPHWTAPANQVIGMSTFDWIGNHYGIIGTPAAESTTKWWSSLRRRVARVATAIPSSGKTSGRPKDVWAFPAALAEIEAGRKRADNPT